MLRLGLNVASTRVVLLEGHQGGDAAGKVIAAFGEFVIGGNYVVGFIVFTMIINFIVITKGAGRAGSDRSFTLDALPGKQMAIDADLNAGVIDQETAKLRRAYGFKNRTFRVHGRCIEICPWYGCWLTDFDHQLGRWPADWFTAVRYDPVRRCRAYILLTIGDGLVAQRR